MRLRILSLRRPALRRVRQLHQAVGLRPKHDCHPVLRSNQATDPFGVGIRRDTRVNNGFADGNILRRQKADNAGPAHGYAVHGVQPGNALLPQIRRGVLHVLFDGHEFRAHLVVTVGNEQENAKLPCHGLRGSLEHPPRLRRALEHGKGLFMLRAKFIDLHCGFLPSGSRSAALALVGAVLVFPK